MQHPVTNARLAIAWAIEQTAMEGDVIHGDVLKGLFGFRRARVQHIENMCCFIPLTVLIMILIFTESTNPDLICIYLTVHCFG
jgi:hypothetical protein